ncbi:hypothetical protein BC829DRAFT_285099 [Chytridium lagenaria]|nr:hypothetical protein BC829DRAFT_285099 [Chytridium lagenaria]
MYAGLAKVKDEKVFNKVLGRSGDVGRLEMVSEDRRKRVEEEIERCVELAQRVLTSNLRTKITRFKEAAAHYTDQEVGDARKAAEDTYNEIKGNMPSKRCADRVGRMVEEDMGEAMRKVGEVRETVMEVREVLERARDLGKSI